VTEGRPLQFTDIDRVGQQIARRNWADIGSNLSGRIASGIETADRGAANVSSSEHHRTKNANEGATLRAVQAIGVTNKAQTIPSAAKRRVSAIYRNATRTKAEGGDIRRGTTLPSFGPGSTRQGLPAGVGWYIDSADEIDRAARAYHHDTPTALAASGSMSPQNSPENERAAVTALMKGHHNNPNVTARTPEGARMMGFRGETAVPGAVKAFRELSSEQLRSIGSTPKQKHIDSPGVSLTDLGKGSTGLQTGVGVLRGNIHPSEIGADTGKVPSYIENHLHAHSAAANVRSEYFRRAHELFSDKPYFEQPTVFGKEWEADPYGKAQSTEGILNPRGNTAEDTWQQGISLGQRNEAKALPLGRGSGRLGKALGSNPVVQAMSAKDVFPTPPRSKSVNAAEIRHAMNNAATIKAAADITKDAVARGRNVGAGMPAIMAQETGWTGYRIEQGKDDLYEGARKQLAGGPPAIRESGKAFAPKGKVSKRMQSVLSEGKPANFVQDSLF
jgi:hypothetical protein